jgi:hypothetical protein
MIVPENMIGMRIDIVAMIVLVTMIARDGIAQEMQAGMNVVGDVKLTMTVIGSDHAIMTAIAAIVMIDDDDVVQVRVGLMADQLHLFISVSVSLIIGMYLHQAMNILRPSKPNSRVSRVVIEFPQ